MLIMDFFNYSPLLGLLLALFLISISFFLRNKSSSSSSSTLLPPGSKGWPIVGESLPFLYTMLKNNPAKFVFDRISKNSSHVFQTHILGENCVVLCGAASNKFLFSNENKLVRVWFPTTFDKLFPLSEQTSGMDHGRLKLRRIIIQLLKPANLQHYIGIMDGICEKHFLSKWENKDEVNVYDLAKDYTFSFACKLFFSVEDTHFEEKLAKPFAIFSSGLLAMPLDVPGTPFRRAIKASKVIRKEIEVIIKQRKVDLANGNMSPTQDILSQVLSTTDENGEFMDERDVVNMLLGLLIGGYDTVSSTCTFIVKYLAELPHIYGQVYKEQMEIANSKKEGELLNWNDINKRMRYSWNVASEVLRLDPPSPAGAFREALTDFKIDGFLIPKGWKIYWSVHSTHKDPKYFKEPEKFDPSRFEGGRPAPYSYVPFGGGPRMCPGNEFARLGILIYMHHLVKRFNWKNISPNKAHSFLDLLFPGKEKLIVQLSPHTKRVV